jgi:peroxiredoxin family protein
MTELLVRLFIGAIATFLAIILWSQTRDAAWMFVITATIVSYGEVVFRTLDGFGVVRLDQVMVFDIPLVSIVLAGLPMALLAVAFAIMVARRGLR